jgi:hypothetical protein
MSSIARLADNRNMYQEISLFCQIDSYLPLTKNEQNAYKVKRI